MRPRAAGASVGPSTSLVRKEASSAAHHTPTALTSIVALLTLPAVAYPGARVANHSRSSALPVTERVVQGTLAGLTPAGGVRSRTSAKATVAALDSDDPATDLTALRRAGFARAALQRFGNGRTTTGLSLAIQLGSPAQARKEVARNAAVIRRDAAHTGSGTAGRVWTLRRIPGSTGFDEHFRGDNGAAIEFRRRYVLRGALLLPRDRRWPQSED